MAVLLVLLYHTGLGPSGGFLGVDIFFVLSGFLITGLLLREHERTGRISLPAFWARRARRLLPASALVVVTTCLLARHHLPAAQWQSIGLDAIAAAGYVLNWRLAARSVDYLAQGEAAGPLQHYWSLAIEEQFYLFWPVLAGLLLRARSRRPIVVGTMSITAGSLVAALTLTGPQAYFTTHTRIWELSAGALCALVMSRRPRREATRPARIDARTRARGQYLVGWAGPVLIAASLLVVRGSTTWPGPLTVPVVAGTCLLLCFGTVPGGPGKLLSWPVLTWIGDISYALYLWHWPLVTLALVDGRLRIREKVAVLVFSVLLAALTHRLVEIPARTARIWARPSLGLVGGLALSLIVVGSGALLAQARSVDDPIDPPGAAGPIEVQASATALAPRPERAKQDTGIVYRLDCPASYTQTRVSSCVFDYRSGPSSPTVVLAGDSKAAQWVPALRRIAEEQHWRLFSITKAGCPFSAAKRRHWREDTVYATCVTWNDRVLRKLGRISPDLLVTTQLESYDAFRDGQILTGEPSRRELVRGLRDRLDQVRGQGIDVLAIAGTPAMGSDMADCVSLHLDDLADCARPRTQVLSEQVVTEAARLGSAPLVDLSDRLCTPTTCPAVIGNVLVYRDPNHLTATYVDTLTPFLNDAMTRVLDQDLVERLGLHTTASATSATNTSATNTSTTNTSSAGTSSAGTSATR